MTEIQGNLKLVIKTWSRDSHGLFDYETFSTKTNQLLISNTCKLIRKKNDVRFVQENNEIEFEERELAKIFFEESKIRLSNPLNFGMVPTESNINDLQNKIWCVIKHDDNSQESQSSILSAGMYEIKLNEIIKLGRVKYAVTEVQIDDNLKTIENHFEKPVFQLFSEYSKIEENPSQEIICKICYISFDDEMNPMINLCKCTGSISSIHFNCLKKWMNTKLSTKENDKKTVISYSMKSFNCEICMAPYPLKFRFENQEYNIIDLVRPQAKNYIILESLNQLKEKNNYKSIQVVTLKENERILMGRGHDTDVRINDISVSRSHADLILIDNKIYIKDLRSKFGTLVLAQKDIELKNKQVNLQIGRSYIEFIFSKENAKAKKDSIGTKFCLNSSLTGSQDDKFLAPIFKSQEIKSIKTENILITSPLLDLECDKVTQINSTNENENCGSTNRKTSAFGNFRSQRGNTNIFSVTNNNSKASSTTNLELNENQNNNNKNKISSIFCSQDNLFKTPSNERINSESSINNTNLKFNLNRNESIDSFRNNSLFTKPISNPFEDNKKTIIQNPLIETTNHNSNSDVQNNDVNKNIAHKSFSNQVFGLGIFEVPNQCNYNNKNTNLHSDEINTIPKELISDINKNNNFERNNNNNNNKNNNQLLNSISKSMNVNLDNQANINYINNFYNNEKNRLMSFSRNENLNINQIPFNNPNQISNSYSHIFNEEFIKGNNFANLGYLDLATYEMKLSLLNSLNNFSNNINSFNSNNNKDISSMNNQVGQSYFFSNLADQNNQSNYLNNQAINMSQNFNRTNINAVENNTNNSFFFNNLYIQKNSQPNININENQSFKTNNSNDLENS